MLPAYWRLRVVNSTDQTITYNEAGRISAIVTPWKMSSGAMAYGANITDATAFLNTGGSLAAAAQVEGTVQNNTSNLYCGFTGLFIVIADVSSTDGTVDLYLESSPDDTNWPSDLADFDVTTDCILLARLVMSTDAVDEGRSCPIEF
jgi:hypothetical protein